MRIILIGNGCSATEEKLGKIIDTELDLVLRMNRFKTEGFEEYVGSRTDIWVVSDNAFKWVLEETEGIEGSQNWKKYTAIYVGVPSFKYQEPETDWSKELGIPVYIFPPNIGDKASIEMNLPSDQWPTLGMHCLYALLSDVENNEIFIYGFDGKDKKYEYFHYYDIGKPEWRTDAYYNKKLNHADKKEFEHIQKLVKDKKIKILQNHYRNGE